MKKYVKTFLLRGMMFGGYGPIIAGIIYAILQRTNTDFSINGYEVCLGIISTYILAFVHAGASVFNQIDHWSIPKSTFIHLSTLYVAYILCYVINSWIPFKPIVLSIFTVLFIAGYFLIWMIVYFITKATEKKLNDTLKN